MNGERPNNSAPAPAQCPHCAQPMRLVRRTLRYRGLPDVFTFECKACGVSRIQEDGQPREKTPVKEIGSWYLDEFGNLTREIKRSD
jgi:transposase-like protein